MLDVPQSDIDLANKHQFTFEICRKDKQHGHWLTVREGIVSLQQAINGALRVPDAYEVAVYTDEGFIYWSTRNPEWFNTTVLEQGRLNDRD